MAFPYDEENPQVLGSTKKLAGNRLPAQQVPSYTPEPPPRIAGPAGAPQLSGPSGAGPLAAAAGMAGRIFGGTASALAGGMTATKKAADTVSAAPDYFASSIGDDGLAANILLQSRATPERVEAPEVEQTPMISRPSPTFDRSGMQRASMSSSGASGDWERTQGGASGDWENAPAVAAPQPEAGRRATIGQPEARPAIAAMPQEPAYNPFNDGTVQIIRPGNQQTMAVQGDYGMTEFDMGAFEQYRTAFDKNPAALSRMEISPRGPVIDGSVVAPDVIAGNRVDEFLGNEARNGATGFSQKTIEELAIKEAEARARAQERNVGAVPAGYERGPDGMVRAMPGVTGSKPLPSSGEKSVSAAATAYDNSLRFANTFKDEYGGNIILGDMENKARRLFGDKSGQGTWWQDVDAQQNQTRNDLFGSALTAPELKAWEKIAITPDMDPTMIRNNLKQRAAIEAYAVSKIVNYYKTIGVSPDAIAALAGPNAAKFLAEPAGPYEGLEKQKADAPAVAPAAAPAAVMPPTRGTPSEWQSINNASAAGQPQREVERDRIIRSELATEQDPVAKAALQREVSRLPTQPATAAQAPTRKSVGGKTYENDGQGWYEVSR